PSTPRPRLAPPTSSARRSILGSAACVRSRSSVMPQETICDSALAASTPVVDEARRLVLNVASVVALDTVERFDLLGRGVMHLVQNEPGDRLAVGGRRQRPL